MNSRARKSRILCRVLCNEGWSCTEAGVEFAEAWDEGHEKVTKELLSSALRPDEEPQ